MGFDVDGIFLPASGDYENVFGSRQSMLKWEKLMKVRNINSAIEKKKKTNLETSQITT